MKRFFFATLFFIASIAHGAECPLHKDHQTEGVNKRGDRAMGFSHENTTHHFFLKDDGGMIQVEANDPQDLESRNAIRSHLSHIALLFSQGNFEIPMFIHDRTPPGVTMMKELKDTISYKYEDMEKGGRVILSSSNSHATMAIHDFLRFQIEDHKTGDHLKPEAR